ncbi:LacI family DNA-binding transcriptional regulator [Frigidibacter sp. RF13]|uniref:LacI family DNA-binding transcriptional regulator n=1 Tax=Frigidibacter sp. RF13 TaxID=2997340 RepID=UPI00227040DE|nr:LacI family DNA-binding transcriptional regulator [Frigidibacter sp. RF13]MCY1127965.1 LacI family DNA-binding transcriptional regulator [Frigidibacter sp. RF13]
MREAVGPGRRQGAVTLREVAERAGVSTSAVSRAFTPGASVSAKKRAAIEAAAQALGYAPSALASALTTGRTQMIGLVSNNFHNPVFLEVFDQFTRGLQDRGLRPLLVNLSGDLSQEEAVQMLRRYSVDGVILASSTLPPAFARRFHEAGLPVVQSFGRWSASPEVNLVTIDNRAAGRLAAERLLACGFAHVGFLGGPEAATSTQDRLAGFIEGVAGRVRVTVSFAGAYSFEAGRAEMQRLLAAGPPAGGYFCGDDVLSIGALSALADAGLKVPGDVGVLGLNDMEMARWAGIDLTTVRQPIAEIIAASIDLVVRAVEKPDLPPEARLFDCSVVERGTLPRLT